MCEEGKIDPIEILVFFVVTFSGVYLTGWL